MAENAPGNARKLVGECRGEFILWETFGYSCKPGSKAKLCPVVWAHQNDMRRLDEKGAQVPVAAFRDWAQDCFATSTILTWNKT